jgi:hypothetical protein
VDPVSCLTERNLVAHLDEFEGDPRRRPLSVDELEAFFAARSAGSTLGRAMASRTSVCAADRAS